MLYLPPWAAIINIHIYICIYDQTHFIISYIVTAMVKLFLSPSKRNHLECITILSVYMLTSSEVAFIMLKNGI